jgi:hypothetical protein
MTLLLEKEDATRADAGMEAAENIDWFDRIWPEDATGTNVETWCEVDELSEGEPHTKRAKKAFRGRSVSCIAC